MRAAAVAAVLSAVVIMCCAGSAPAQLPQMKPVAFEQWGFQVSVPREAERYALEARADVLLSELFVHGDLIYFVKLTKVPESTLASTAIEKALQSDFSFASKLGPAKRWELDSKQGELFKGLTRLVNPDDMPAEAPYLKRVLKSRAAAQSACMAPVKDESSPVLTVGVIGPKERESEIENTAKFFAFGTGSAKEPTEPAKVATVDPGGVSRAEPAKVRPSEPAKELPPAPLLGPPAKPADVAQPKPGMQADAPAIAPITPAVPSVAKPAQPAQAVRPKPRPTLKKGDIELLGMVELIAADRKSLVMLVDQIIMPGMKPIPLDPARRKLVLVKDLTAGVAAGARIAAIGKNEGVGKPLIAAWLEAAARPAGRQGN